MASSGVFCKEMTVQYITDDRKHSRISSEGSNQKTDLERQNFQLVSSLGLPSRTLGNVEAEAPLKNRG